MHMGILSYLSISLNSCGCRVLYKALELSICVPALDLVARGPVVPWTRGPVDPWTRGPVVPELVVPELVVRELVDRELHIGSKIFSALRADRIDH